VAVALGAAVYLWNANTGDIEQLMECSEEDDYITSVSWVQMASTLLSALLPQLFRSGTPIG